MGFFKRNSRPTAADAAWRLVALKHIVAPAVATPPREVLGKVYANWTPDEIKKFEREAESRRDEYCEHLRARGVWKHMSPKEQEFAQATLCTVTPRQHVDATWRAEAVQVLLWALGMLPELPPYDTQADVDLLKKVPSRDMETFVRAAQLRPREEIDAARETAESWHWRSRTRELIERGDTLPNTPEFTQFGFRTFDDIVRAAAKNRAEAGELPPIIDEDYPVKGKAYRDMTDDEWSEVRSITVERHCALNWLCGYAPKNRWDETPTDT